MRHTDDRNWVPYICETKISHHHVTLNTAPLSYRLKTRPTLAPPPSSRSRSHHRSPGSTRSARSPGSTRSGGICSRAASAASRSSSLGGDEERLPLMVGGGVFTPSSNGSLSMTTATNTLSNNNTSSGSLGRLGTGSSLGGSGSSSRAVFSKPAKTVSFAGDDDDDDDDDVSDGSTGSPMPSLRRNGINGHSRGRAALEERSPERSPLRGGSSRSPLSRRGTSYGVAGVGPRTNGGALAAMEAGVVAATGEALGAGDSRGWDETAGGAVTVSGGTGSLTRGGEGEEEDSAEEGEMISFIVLDCSKVTNVSRRVVRSSTTVSTHRSTAKTRRFTSLVSSYRVLLLRFYTRQL